MEDPNRKGLSWKESQFGPREPSWSYDPPIKAIEKVCRQKLEIADGSPCTVTFHAQGAFNKLYLVETPHHSTHKKLMMRVTLPVDPHNKVRAEVATLRWVKRKTDIPVPAIICFDDSSDNDIGFAWMLMEIMPGTSAYKLWRKMTMDQKTALVERVAEYEDQLLRASSEANFRHIGSLSVDDGEEENESPSPKPGRIVDHHWFMDDHFNYDDPDNEEEDIDWINAFIKVAMKLLALLPKTFPSLQRPSERTYLWHSDLNMNNILLDDEGNITAVLDWESLSCQPLWVSTQVPHFLLATRPRERQPLRDGYADDDGTIENSTGLDNEGKNTLFWDHLMQWEQTQLSKVYNARMEQLRPAWEQERLDGALKRDFLLAAHQISLFCINVGYMEFWVDMAARGKVRDLMKVLRSRTYVKMAGDEESEHWDLSDDEDSDSEEDSSDDESDEEEDGSGAEDAEAEDAKVEGAKAEDAELDDVKAGDVKAGDVKAVAVSSKSD
ncbi:phosphotransferase enzyme family-domain-containing protein [Coniochaeta sp. 2T2.1]|nr:phosphotransferase enzyme family-domain-containing protein [Coniochaeta sp. 2T2.1]